MNRLAPLLIIVALPFAPLWTSAMAQEPKLQVTFQGGTSALTALDISPDGKTLATGSGMGIIMFWDLTTTPPKNTARFQQHKGYLGSIKFSPDGKTLATGGSDGRICLLDLTKQTTKATYLISPHSVWTLAFNKDSDILASSTVNSGFAPVVLWDLSGKRRAAKPSGVTKGYKGPLLKTFVGPRNENLSSLAMSANDKLLATPADKSIILWDVGTGESVNVIKLEERPFRVAFSPDGKLAGCLGTEIKVWDSETAKECATLKGHDYNVNQIAFSPDGALLATGDAGDTKAPKDARKGTVRLWDVTAGKVIGTLEGHTHQISGLAFTVDSRKLVSASWDGEVRVWLLPRGKQ